MSFHRLKRRTASVLNLLLLKLREKRWRKRLKYIYLSKGGKCDSLFIVFSAFNSTNIRTYNYVRALKGAECDRLYILDVWGYRGSYYLYENGSDEPYRETLSLIHHILGKKKYKKVVTMGTSKGGTAAIYYGLEINATEILAGACQYNLGNYLFSKEAFAPILAGMVGNNAGQREKDLLNSIMPLQLRKHAGGTSVIHLIYSKKEPTYEKHTVDLLKQLKECRYTVVEKEYEFANHDDVGIYFKQYLSDYMKSQ